MNFKHLEDDNLIIEEKKQTDSPMYGRDVSGYGRKIPTSWMVRLNKNPKTWRRVYCICYGNIGTCYIVVNKQNYVVDF